MPLTSFKESTKVLFAELIRPTKFSNCPLASFLLAADVGAFAAVDNASKNLVVALASDIVSSDKILSAVSIPEAKAS